MWISLISYFVMGVTMAYLLMMLLMAMGWIRLSIQPDYSDQTLPKVSVVVAARNEEPVIENLIQCLINQSYPKHLLELIIVDDNSSDNTKAIAQKHAKNHVNGQFYVLSSEGEGKKAALRQGIMHSGGDIIVTTDADCTMPEDWIKTLIRPFCDNNTMIVLSSVVYHKTNGFLQQFFAIEFMSLVASGAGAAGLGLPFMGNAANMAFRRSVYEQAHQSAEYNHYTSGDDIFLLHQTIHKHGHKSICFLPRKEAIVTTVPPNNLSQFIIQRLRWASKSKGYKLPMAIGVAIIVLLMNSILAISLIAGVFIPWILIIFALLMLTKMLADFPLINRFTRFVQRRDLMPFFVPFSVIYPFYLTLTGISSFFVRFTWKGRRYSK